MIREVSGTGGEAQPGSQPPWPAAALDSLVRVSFTMYKVRHEYYLKKLSRGHVIHLSLTAVTSTPKKVAEPSSGKAVVSRPRQQTGLLSKTLHWGEVGEGGSGTCARA